MEQLKRLSPGTTVSVWNEHRSTRFIAVIQEPPANFPTLYLVEYHHFPAWIEQPPAKRMFVEASNVQPYHYL